MSRITTIYDRIIAELLLLYPESDSYTRIPYAYDLPSNDDNFMRKGWGIKVGDANQITLEFCNLAYERNFSVVLTREVFNTGSNPVIYDDIIKALLEDIYRVQNRFYAPDQLAIDDDIVKVDPTSITAAEEVATGKTTFLSMEISFTFTVRESL